MKDIISFFSILVLTVSSYAQAELVFVYDTAGNQISRKFEIKPKSLEAETEDDLVAQDIDDDEDSLLIRIEQSITIHPNPVKDKLYMTWDIAYHDQIQSIYLIDTSSKQHQLPHYPNRAETHIQVAGWPAGLYVVKCILKDGSEVNKKVIVL